MKRPGFTILDFLVAMSLVVILTAIGVPSVNAMRRNTMVKREVYALLNMLREAQQESVVSQTGSVHGVSVAVTHTLRYEGEWPGTIQEEHFFEGGITAIAGSGQTVTFERLTGTTNMDYLITLGYADGPSMDLSVTREGVIYVH